MEYKYKAFISYRRTERDSAAAEMLQQMLEQYVIPEGNPEGVKKKLGPIFRDKTHIDADPNLRQRIYNALDSSEYLIVICSKDIMDTDHPWVMDEIQYFLNKHPDSRNKILTVLVGGEPKEAIPDILWTRKKSSDGTTDIELPFYLDIRGKNILHMRKKVRDEIVKIYATLLSCNPDTLAMREEKRRRKQTLRWMGGITIIAAIIIGLLVRFNIQIDNKNKELEQQINERLLRESELLTQSSIQALSSGDQHGAIRDAIDALPSADTPRPYYAPAEQALFSALDLFDPSASDLILRDIVLELTSPVESFCINADGTRLTITDHAGNLNCFSAATGEHIWAQTLSGSLYPCELYDSLIVINGNTITSICQDTGEILWVTVNDSFSNRIEFSNDSSYAFCLVDDECFGSPMLIQISMLDGSVIRTTQVIDEDIRAGTFHTDVYDFSTDGRFFAGSIQVYDTADNQAIVFLMDVNTGETEILQILRLPHNLIPCSMEFTDQDTTLTITHYADNHPFTYRAEKIRISDGKILWRTDTPEEEFSYYAHFMKWLDWLHFDAYLLIGAQRVLYVLDMATGEIIDTEYLDSKLICLEQLDQDTFSIVLEDGTYTTGHISDDDIDLHTNMTYLFDPVPVMELGDVWDILLINGGYLRGKNGTELRPTTINSENNLPCSVALIPQQDDWKVIIRQAVSFDPALNEKELYTYDYSDPHSNVGAVLRANTCGADTLLLEDNWYSYGRRYMFFDRATLELKDSFVDSDLFVYSFQKGGTDVLGIDSEGILCIYDRTSSKTTPLSPTDGEIQMTFDGRSIESAIIGWNYGRLNRDHTLVTIITTEHGLRMWLDGQKQSDVPFPAELSGSFSEGETRCDLLINENGFVQLDLRDEDWECICNNYYFFSIWENKWYSFPGDECIHDTCLSTSKSTFTVLNNAGTIRVYDIPSGEEKLQFNITLHPSVIQDMCWIMDDRYLAVRVNDLQLFILDGITGEIVFSHTATMINAATLWEYPLVYEPQFATDPSGKRLYIWDQEGICVDTESWTKLVDIPHMLMYDSVSDKVFTFDSFGIPENQPKHVTAVSLPTTEELVYIGKGFLNN